MRTKPYRKSITIQDVAKAACVSVSTVSRVLNNKDDVAFETYEKVQQVIEQLNYTSSLAARGMRSRRTNVIGVVISEVDSSYSFEILRGVNRVIAESDYHLLIYTSGDARKFRSENQESQYVMLLNGGITDGVIVVTPSTGSFNPHSPLVIVDPYQEEPETHTIYSTNYKGACDAIEYLVSLGHRRIAHLTGAMALISAAQRLQGYKDGLAAAGIPVEETLIQEGDFTVVTAQKCAMRLLSLPEPPTAIFAANDMSAMAIYQAAQQMGVRIPQDLSVIGFDNLRDSEYLDPPLTTIDQSIFDMGVLATRLMMNMLRGENPENKQHVFPTRLIIRESCRSLN
jgi:LacI family transcriptional regulator